MAEQVKIQVYPFRFMPGGDGLYYHSHTWLGRAYDWAADWTPPPWTDPSSSSRTFTPQSSTARTFTDESGSEKTWIYDP